MHVLLFIDILWFEYFSKLGNVLFARFLLDKIFL